MPNWKKRLETIVSTVAKQSGDIVGAYARANADAVIAAVAGRGPDDSTSDPTLGARAVYNIPAVHVPAFCKESEQRKLAPATAKSAFRPYKNGYDLRKYHVGGAPNVPVTTRELVDRALPLPNGKDAAEVYFGAVELNGAGVRFYGDICLVLKPDAVPTDTVVLESNSYDLVRAPLLESITSAAKTGDTSVEQETKQRATERSGTWQANLGDMGAIKVIGSLLPAERRLTAGTMSDGVLADEDYLEVLRIGTFGTENLLEVRLTATDVALETRIGNELQDGRTPTPEELLWRQRRRAAVGDLRAAGVSVRVVTTTGRVRSS